MAIQVRRDEAGEALIVRAQGTLTEGDYHWLQTEFEQMFRKHDHIDFLVDLRDFEGMTPGAVWEELRFDDKHLSDAKRIAVLGDAKWQEWATKITKPFTSAEVRYFDADENEAARRFVGAKVEG